MIPFLNSPHHAQADADRWNQRVTTCGPVIVLTERGPVRASSNSAAFVLDGRAYIMVGSERVSLARVSPGTKR
jgi:hypothetical protein